MDHSMEPSYTDSHVHFDDFHEAGEEEAAVQRARAVGVDHLVAIGGRVDSNRLAVELAARHEQTLHAVLGFDRDQTDSSIDWIGFANELKRPGVVGVGETGLDYHYSADTAEEQKALFQKQLEVAVATRLPVVVHSRDAEEDTTRLLAGHAESWKGARERMGVLHCFTGSLPFAVELIALGYMISFSGIITFKNAESLRQVAREVPDEHLLVETDAPYLAPVPYRGKRNEPAYVVEVAKCLAEIRGQAGEKIAKITTDNARRLFNF